MSDRPHSVDNSVILKRLMANTRVKEATRRKIANDTKTEALLEAGLRLLTGHHDDRLEVRPGEASPREYLWFSVRQVVEEANRRGNEGREITSNTMLDRWPSRADYDEDLIAYALSGSHGLSDLASSDESRRALREEDFATAVHRVAYRYVVEMTASLGFQATLASAVMARYDPAVTEANVEIYNLITEAWSGLYSEVMRSRGLKLRPGISLTDFTYMLTALADGIGLRMLTDANSVELLVDHEKKESFLGKAILAVAVACFDPGDGMSHEELIGLITAESKNDSESASMDWN